MAELATNQGKNGQLNMKWTAFLLLLLAIGGDALAAPAQVRLLQAPAWRERDGSRHPLHVGMALESGDIVHTGRRSRAILSLEEGSIVKLGENAHLDLRELIPPEEETGVFEGFLDVVKGAFRFTTTLASRKRNIRARVRTATIGIRGTDVWGKAEEERDFVVLLEGKISIERDGQSYELDEPLSLFMAPRGQPAEPIGPVDSDDLAEWAQETEPQPEGGVVSGEGHFVLNLASFTDEAVAAQLSAGLATAGYAAAIEPVTVNDLAWYRVEISGYDSVADAAFVAESLREQFNLQSPWISKSD